MKRIILMTILLFNCALFLRAQHTVSQDEMEPIYKKVQTPYKYGLVVAPQDKKHMIDCPTVFHHNGLWYMTYLVFDGRGYETWIAQSDNLLEWETKGRILSFRNNAWDKNQRGGFPALTDMKFGGSYELQTYDDKYWMTYMGGANFGYEAIPLQVGLAWTSKENIGKVAEWESLNVTVLSPLDENGQWFDNVCQYKSTVYWDKNKILGSQFVMFYNAAGINPKSELKAERVGIALSEDMKNWKRYPSNPVFTHEVANMITGDAHIQKIDNLYVMFYFSAHNPSRAYKAYNTFACSYDLIHWNEWKGEDLVFPTEEYDNLYAHKSYVVKHNDVVYHFYCAVNKQRQRGIAVATSKPMGKSEVCFPHLK